MWSLSINAQYRWKTGIEILPMICKKASGTRIPIDQLTLRYIRKYFGVSYIGYRKTILISQNVYSHNE